MSQHQPLRTVPSVTDAATDATTDAATDAASQGYLDALAAIDAIPVQDSQETCVETQDYTKEIELPFFESPPASFLFEEEFRIEEEAGDQENGNLQDGQEIVYDDYPPISLETSSTVILITTSADTTTTSANTAAATMVEERRQLSPIVEEEEEEEQGVASDFTLSPPPTPTPVPQRREEEEDEVIDLTLEDESPTIPPLASVTASSSSSSSSSIVWLSADRRPLKRVIELKSNGRKKFRVYETRNEV